MKHFFFDLLLYKVIRIIFHIFAEISIFLYKLNRNNKKKNCIYSVPAVNTIGDALEHIEYFRLSNKLDKNYKLLIINEFPINVYCNFLLRKNNYEFYSENFYKYLLSIIKVIPSKNGYLKRTLNHVFLTSLRKKISNLNFYKQENIDKKIIKKLKDKNYTVKFINAFKEFNYNFSKSNQKFYLEHLRKKFGYQKLNQKRGFNTKTEKAILKQLSLKKKKYVCLNIRTEKGKNIRDSNNLSSYKKIIEYLLKKNFSVVLTGSKNEYVKNYFLKEKRIIDYRNSKYQNLINDFYIIGNCKFMISQISGPILIAISMNIPILILDAATLEEAQLNKRILYLPKIIKHIKNRKKIKNYFKNSMIFADKNFNRKKFVETENSENVKLKCLKFFLASLKKNNFEILKNKSIENTNYIDKDIQRISYANRKRIFKI